VCLLSFSFKTLCQSANRVTRTVFVMPLRCHSPMMTHEQGPVAVKGGTLLRTQRRPYIPPMIRIAISLAAYQAIASTIPGGASN
jgi:hypothetical protein